MARVLFEFCKSGFEPVENLDFEVVSATSLGDRDAAMEEDREFSTLLLAFSQEDMVAPGTELYLKSWAALKLENGEKPAIICREGALDSGTRAPEELSWTTLMEKLAEEFEAEVIWDSRPLFSVSEEKDPRHAAA
ncbi:MAG: hypothetical protein WD342_10785 [Verrucomicrobiales bacterium]